MATAVDFRTYTPEDSRLDLLRRLEAAPKEHAAAILELYELLDRLHESGIVAIANGLLSAGPTVVDKLTDVAVSGPAVTALRLGLIFGNLATSVDPTKVHTLVVASQRNPASWWQIVSMAFSRDTRRALGLGLGLLNVFGAALTPCEGKAASTKERP